MSPSPKRLLLSTLLLSALLAACSDTRTGGGDDDENNATSCDPGYVLVGGRCRPVSDNNGTGINNPTNNNPANNSAANNSPANNNPANNNPANNNPANNNTPGPCVSGESRCADDTTVERCTDPEAGAWTPEPCDNGLVCARGACREPICTPGDILGCSGPNALAICNAAGTGTEPRDCQNNLYCRDGACTDRICDEGETACLGTDVATICSPDGTDFVEERRCGAGTVCDQGRCASLCEINSKESSYLGCDYWAVDLDNIERDGGTDQPAAVVISNPNPDLTAEITITIPGVGPLTLNNPNVAPGGLSIFELPTGRHIDGSGLYNSRTFRVDSSIPVTVHQFNPLNGENVFTNDASLLLPSNALGTEYMLMSWQHASAGLSQAAAYGTLVAVEEGTTEVTIRPTANIAQGNGLAGGITAGMERTVTLNQGQVLSLATTGATGADLTGSYIRSSKKIAVFAGHECANIPTVSTNYCDHIEQQMFPLDTWGEDYFVVPFSPRNASQRDTFTIIAGDDTVTIRTFPPQPFDGLSLAFGQKHTFETNQSFRIMADGPILVGQFLHGSNYSGFSSAPECSSFGGRTGIGDPAFTLTVPSSQYRDEYIVLTPSAYLRDYLNIIAPVGANITVDGQPVAGLQDIGNTGFSYIQLLVQDGVHVVRGDQPFGLVAYGYDCDVSYAYPGGLNLEALR